jgi:hypothetical protein
MLHEGLQIDYGSCWWANGKRFLIGLSCTQCCRPGFPWIVDCLHEPIKAQRQMIPFEISFKQWEGCMEHALAGSSMDG